MKTEKLVDLLEINDNNYDAVTDVLLNRFDIVGDIAFTDFNELLNFKNIENLSIVNFSLDDDFLFIIYKLRKLKHLQLINCDINFGIDLFNDLKISDLSLDNSYVDFNNINNKYNSVRLKNMNVDCSNIHTDILGINGSDIDINTINFDNIKTLEVSLNQFNNCTMFRNNYPVHIVVWDDVGESVVCEYEKN